MATSIDQSNFVKTALRLPPELHAAVHACAKESGRSYNGELIALIEAALSPEVREDASLTGSVLAELHSQAALRRVQQERLVQDCASLAYGARLIHDAMANGSASEPAVASEIKRILKEADAAIAAARESLPHQAVLELKAAMDRRDALAHAFRSVAAPPRKRALYVGDVGGGEPAHDKVMIPMKTPPVPNRGPTRSPNARKPKP